MTDKCVYRFSKTAAINADELDVWLESQQLNEKCSRFIEHDLKNGKTPKEAIDLECERFGIDRVYQVLAMTALSDLDNIYLSKESIDFSNKIYIPRENMDREIFIKTSPKNIERLSYALREKWNSLNLFSEKDVIENRIDSNLQNKILVLRPTLLTDEYKTPDNQLFFAQSGDGCFPNRRGRSIFGVFLKDNQEAVYSRHDFLGELKSDLLPKDFEEKINEIKNARMIETQSVYTCLAY